MKHARGQNKLFQNASLLMCFCNFATGYFLTLKTQSVKHVIELMFKCQISPDHPTHGVQRRMISVDNFFRIFEIIIFCFVVALCDLVHDVETIFHLFYVLTASRNPFF